MAEDDNTLTDAIAENAAGPKRAAGDTGSIEQHSLPDLIEADKYLAAKKAARKGKGLGIRFVKLVPPGQD